jgi:hypothetical protein
MEDDNFHLLVKCKIGKQPVNLIVDTGASHTCIDKTLIQNVFHDILLTPSDTRNVGLGGSDWQGLTAIVPDFKIGRRQFAPYLVHIIDFQVINAAYEQMKLPGVHGILGCDFCIKHKVGLHFSSSPTLVLWEQKP